MSVTIHCFRPNTCVHEQDLIKKFPHADLELIEVFEELVYQAAKYKYLTNRYLPIFGESGELFAEITFGIKRHKPRTQGSDGRLGNDFIELSDCTHNLGILFDTNIFNMTIDINRSIISLDCFSCTSEICNRERISTDAY